MFFSDTVGIKLGFFDLIHISQIVLMFVVFFLIYYYRKELKWFKYEKQLRYTFATILLLMELFLHVWNMANDNWSLLHNLPLHLCAINVYLAAIMFYTKNEKLFDVIYFWGFGGLLSVLFPDTSYGPDRFRFYQYFLAHMFFMWFYLYMIYVHGFKPTVKKMYRSALVLFVLAIGFVFPFNLITGENFMFVVSSGGTPLSIIEGYGQFVYTAGTVVAIFIVMMIWYSPIYLYFKNKDA